MAGFLAPQIQDIDTRGNDRGSGSTSTAGAIVGGLSSFGNILASGISNSSAPQPSQDDRDAEALRPIFAEIADLQEQRGKIGGAQFQARANAKFAAALVANPTLATDLKTGFTALTGLEFGEADVDIGRSFEESTVDWLANTIEGRANAEQAYRFEKSGALNTSATLAAAGAIRVQRDADDLHLKNLKTLQETEAATTGIDENRQKVAVDTWTNNFGTQAFESVNGLIRAAAAAGTTSQSSAELLADVRSKRALMAINFTEQARQGGFANHPDFKIDTVLQPYDAIIELVTESQGDLPRLLTQLAAADDITIGRAINGITSMGGYNPDIVKQVFANIGLQNGPDLRALGNAMIASPTSTAMVGKPLFDETVSPVSADNPPVPTGGVTPEARVVSKNLSNEERIAEVTGGLANFASYDSRNGGDEKYRDVAVTGFALAALAMNEAGQATAEEVFDKAYSPKFFQTYGEVTSFGDVPAANLQQAVNDNLTTLFFQRKRVLDNNIQGNLQFTPSLGINFVDGQAKLVFPPDAKGATGQEARLLTALRANNLSLDMEGVDKLFAISPEVVISANLNRNGDFLRLDSPRGVLKDIRYLNKIVTTAGRLPDLNPHLVPNMKKALEVVTAAPIVHITSAKDLEAVGSGEDFTFIGKDGTLVTSTKP